MTVVSSGVYGVAQPQVSISTSSYELAVSDAGFLIKMTNSGAITLELPDNTTAAIPVGTYFDVYQGGGQITFTSTGGASLVYAAGLANKSREEHSRVGIQKIATNVWNIFGDLELA